MSHKTSDIRTSSPASILKGIARILGFVILGMIMLSLILTSYFTIRKDYFGKKILQAVNNKIQGELSFKDLYFSSFKHFPNISVSLKEVDLFEYPQSENDSSELPVVRFENIRCALNIKKMFQGNIVVSKILIDDGSIFISRYSDSTFNFINAIRLVNLTETTEDIRRKSKLEAKNADSNKTDTTGIQFDLKSVLLKELYIVFEDQFTGKKSDIDIKNLRASFKYTPEEITSNVKTILQIRNYMLSEDLVLKNIDINLKSALYIDRIEELLRFERSDLTIGKAQFSLQGTAGYGDNSSIDLQVDGSDKDLSFFSIFLSQEGLKNLKDGDIYFRGTISGKTDRGIPNVECQFGIHDMRMLIPKSGLYIENGELTGFFRSGLREDLSEAFLRIDTLKASLPDGYINGSFSIKNFKLPYLNYQLNIKTNIAGFDDVFKLDKIDELEGYIHFNDKYAGHFSPNSGWAVDRFYQSSLVFDSVSFSIPDVIKIDHLHGHISGNLDSIEIKDLDIRSGNSDILINGNLYGISQFVLDSEQAIAADLRIVSNNFDLPGTLSFLPRISWTFPYQIKDIDLDVLMSSSKTALTEFNRTPEINFKIKYLEGTLDKLINPATITNGSFSLSERDSTLNLKFDGFDIKIAGSELLADVNLAIPPNRNLELEINVLAENFRPAKVLFRESSDSFPNILYSRIDGDLNASLYFIKDTASILTSLDFSSGKLTYTGSSDTISIQSLHLNMEREQYKIPRGTNPLAVLTSNIKLGAQSIQSGHFKVEDVEYQIDTDEGVYTIIPLHSIFFGKPGTGIFTVAPFAKPLWGHIEYSVKQFQIENLLSTFRKDPNLSGPMDFGIVMDFQGSSLDTILSTMNADIHVKAQDLRLMGLDIDKFITRFQRSQHFNLVDVGAVLLAGPVGLAVTKGSDFAMIFVNNPAEISAITELISDYSFKHGQLELSDVAFSTEKNRIVAKGWLNFISDSLDITIGVVNPNGCEILSQQVHGPLKEPELGKVHIIAKLFAPVSNLFKNISRSDCDPFYTGKLKHPEPKEKD